METETMFYTAYKEDWKPRILASLGASHLISTPTELYKD